MTDYSLDEAITAADSIDSALRELAESTDGRLIRPAGDDYDAARRVWNGLIDRYPVGIIYATGVDDVRATVETARRTDRGIALRAGGHSGPGFSTADGEILLDVSAMNGVRVDETAEIARVGAGAIWRTVDETTQSVGLATPGGIVSDTGVAGLTLGGGTDWLTRPHGLASDRLRAVELLTAQGEHVRASDTSNPDLFRALQGGGGNFGVVTTFEFDLVPLDHPVAFGEAWYPIDRLSSLLADYRIVQSAASRSTTISPYVGSMPNDPTTLGVCFLGVYAGPPAEGEVILQDSLDFGDPASLTIDRYPYTELQTLFDEDAIEGERYYWKSIAVDDLTPAILETFVDRANRMPGDRDTALIWPMGGAVSEVSATETAFYQREAAYVLNFEAAWADPQDDEIQQRWARESVAAIRALDGEGVLPNFAGTERDIDAAREIFGENIDWLREVKTNWDPDDIFGPSGRLEPL